MKNSNELETVVFEGLQSNDDKIIIIKDNKNYENYYPLTDYFCKENVEQHEEICEADILEEMKFHNRIF